MRRRSPEASSRPRRMSSVRKSNGDLPSARMPCRRASTTNSRSFVDTTGPPISAPAAAARLDGAPSIQET